MTEPVDDQALDALIRHAADGSFNCGAWESSGDESYQAVRTRSIQAWEALKGAYAAREALLRAELDEARRDDRSIDGDALKIMARAGFAGWFGRDDWEEYPEVHGMWERAASSAWKSLRANGIGLRQNVAVGGQS